MKIAVIQFPGSNCERETCLALKRAGLTAIEFLWNEEPSRLASMDGFIVIGGFSYEDRSRAGIIAAQDPLMSVLKQESLKGKPLMGICNGAQILVESGLVPGYEGYQIGMALTENKRIQNGKILGTGFYNAWVHLRKPEGADVSLFTRLMQPGERMCIPAAHAQGRFLMPKTLQQQVLTQGLLALDYVGPDGELSSEFPVNPNGSMLNMAAVSNPAGNVLAIMPHPERTPAGDKLFSAMADYLNSGVRVAPRWLENPAVEDPPQDWQPEGASQEWLAELIITDNEAQTVANSLARQGLPLAVSRYVHWSLFLDNEAQARLIKDSDLLCNPRKEHLMPTAGLSQSFQLRQGPASDQALALLVRDRDNLHGQEKVQQLVDHFGLEGSCRIRHGILWVFRPLGELPADWQQQLLATHIIHNPYAHEHYVYPLEL